MVVSVHVKHSCFSLMFYTYIANYILSVKDKLHLHLITVRCKIFRNLINFVRITFFFFGGRFLSEYVSINFGNYYTLRRRMHTAAAI